VSGRADRGPLLASGRLAITDGALEARAAVHRASGS